MPLIALWSSNRTAIDEFSIEQVVAAAGDGNLRDGSVCSQELRTYFSEITSSKLAKYIEHCLSQHFSKSGMVLQDLVNELGRRLDYKVANGRYQGTSNAIGYDGLWTSPEGRTIIVEVKTTDAYRISLQTIATYRDRASANGEVNLPSSILIVVGREDTGELEAQVHGSRHAWDIRLISADALIKLVQLKEDADAPDTGRKIRSLLAPMEYTRLDEMIDIMFTTAKDVETAAVVETVTEAEEFGGLAPSNTTADLSTETTKAWEFTDAALLQEKRNLIIDALSRYEKVNLIKRTRALYWDASLHGASGVYNIKTVHEAGRLPILVRPPSGLGGFSCRRRKGVSRLGLHGSCGSLRCAVGHAAFHFRWIEHYAEGGQFLLAYPPG